MKIKIRRYSHTSNESHDLLSENHYFKAEEVVIENMRLISAEEKAAEMDAICGDWDWRKDYIASGCCRPSELLYQSLKRHLQKNGINIDFDDIIIVPKNNPYVFYHSDKITEEWNNGKNIDDPNAWEKYTYAPPAKNI